VLGRARWDGCSDVTVGEERVLRMSGGWGSVLLYLTSAGSMARAGAIVSGCRCWAWVERTAVVVACHAGVK